MVCGFDCIQNYDYVFFLCNVLFPKNQSVFYRVDMMFLHSPLSGRAVETAWPAKRTVGDSDLHQQLIDLLQHSLMDGACVVRFLDELSDPETVFVTSDRLTVCPVPPLALIEQALRGAGMASELQQLDRQILPTYHLYASCLSNDGGRLSYLVAWHSSNLQPWQYYMLEQVAAVLKQEKPTSQQILTLLQDVEHQIRTPLSLIQLYTDLLNRESSPAEKKTHIQQIQSTVAGLQSTLKKLTQGELRNGPKCHQVNLKLLLLDVLELLQPMLEQREINLALDFQDCAIALDDWQICQVLQNIIDNAIWFSPVGGTITCRCLRFQKEVLIQIADQGVGLSSQDQQNLFQVNYSQRPGGTGMGMMIAKQIIQQHGGRIWAENLPTGGTQFGITLPC
jgi:signal transduction histidine kinase